MKQANVSTPRFSLYMGENENIGAGSLMIFLPFFKRAHGTNVVCNWETSIGYMDILIYA